MLAMLTLTACNNDDEPNSRPDVSLENIYLAVSSTEEGIGDMVITAKGDIVYQCDSLTWIRRFLADGRDWYAVVYNYNGGCQVIKNGNIIYSSHEEEIVNMCVDDGNIYTLPDVLLQRRSHDRQVSRQHRERQIQCDKATQEKLLEELLGRVTDEELDLHYIHSTGYYREATISPEIAAWYTRLIRANESLGMYNQKAVKKYVVQIEKRLIRQTFRRDMSKAEKAMLFFRYLPFCSAVKATMETTLLKIRGRQTVHNNDSQSKGMSHE